MLQSLGFIETRSLTGAIEASDVMTKTANVTVIGTVKIGSGLVNVVIEGEVSSVEAAVKAGEAAARPLGEVYAVHVIPRPHQDIAKILPSFY